MNGFPSHETCILSHFGVTAVSAGCGTYTAIGVDGALVGTVGVVVGEVSVGASGALQVQRKCKQSKVGRIVGFVRVLFQVEPHQPPAKIAQNWNSQGMAAERIKASRSATPYCCPSVENLIE